VIPAILASDEPEYVKTCQDFYNTQLEALQIFCTKHHQYGPGNIAALGPDGVLSRMEDDKLSRIKHARADESDCNVAPGDSTADAHLDAANYMIIRLMLLRNQWPMPGKREQLQNLYRQRETLNTRIEKLEEAP
jgi:hypothetical protein